MEILMMIYRKMFSQLSTSFHWCSHVNLLLYFTMTVHRKI